MRLRFLSVASIALYVMLCGLTSDVDANTDGFDDFIDALDRDTALFVYCDDVDTVLKGTEGFPLFEGDGVDAMMARIGKLENAEATLAKFSQLKEIYKETKANRLIKKFIFVVHSINDDGSVADWSFAFQFDKRDKAEFLQTIEKLIQVGEQIDAPKKTFQGTSAQDLSNAISTIVDLTIKCSVSDDWIGFGSNQTLLDVLANSDRVKAKKSLATNRAVKWTPFFGPPAARF